MTGQPDWALDGMRRDTQSITRDWQFVNQLLIEGVKVTEVTPVMTNYGMLTEVYRRDWMLDSGPVDQVFQSVLEPGGISGWHAHGETTDRLFVAAGRMRIVLFDGRRRSTTHTRVNEFRFGSSRPALVVIPPGVWHAIENIGGGPAMLLNAVDKAYSYEQPDHYRLPLDTDQIPYIFRQGRGNALDGSGKHP